MKTLIVACFSVLLLVTGMMPVIHVSAQRFSNTGTTAETAHFFQELTTEDRVQNETFLLAFEDYQMAVNHFVLHDISDDTSVGSSIDEVYDNFVTSVEEAYFELSEDEAYLSYMYYIDEELQAELLLYFVDTELYYIGLTNLQVDINLNDFVANDTMQSWIDEEITMDELVNESFRVTGVSEVLYDELPYYMMMVPTGDSEDALSMDYTIFIGDTMFESYMLDFYYSFEAPQDNMIQYFAYFLGISEEYPVAE